MDKYNKEQLTHHSWIGTGFLPDDISLQTDDDFAELWDMRPGFRNKINIFGKVHDMPREQQVYGLSQYTYSGTTFDTKEVPPIIQRYIDWANNYHQHGNSTYNMVLINWYHNGNDNIGWHTDNEKEIIPGTDVMTISFGQSRMFKVKHNTDKELARNFPTQHNGYIIMGGDFQNEFKHSIPKTTKKTSQSPRISITFRCFQ